MAGLPRTELRAICCTPAFWDAPMESTACPTICSALESLLVADSFARMPPPLPLERCGLLLPSKRNLLLLACTFEAYHALKNEIRSKFDAQISNQIDYHANWLLFARHMGAAAVERSLARTLFNPLQFESFLSSFLNT